MYRSYYNRTTPILAFLEGFVRVFDWGILLEIRRRWGKGGAEPETRRDKEWGNRIVDWYMRDAIATFETQELDRLAEEPILPRRTSAAADVLLGPLPTKEVILWYEQIVPGACDRIMNMASERLERDGDAEVELLKQRGRQGYMGMIAGLVLSLLLAASALYLIIVGYQLAGFFIVGINISLAVLATAYVSKAQVRRKLYTRDFFSWKRRRS